MSRAQKRCWYCGCSDFSVEVDDGGHIVLVCSTFGKATTLDVREEWHGEPEDEPEDIEVTVV